MYKIFNTNGEFFVNLGESEIKEGWIPKTTRFQHKHEDKSRIRILKCHWRTNVQIKSPVTSAFVTGLSDCTFVHLYIFFVVWNSKNKKGMSQDCIRNGICQSPCT